MERRAREKEKMSKKMGSLRLTKVVLARVGMVMRNLLGSDLLSIRVEQLTPTPRHFTSIDHSISIACSAVCWLGLMLGLTASLSTTTPPSPNGTSLEPVNTSKKRGTDTERLSHGNLTTLPSDDTALEPQYRELLLRYLRLCYHV
jgi:hypothetical protein